MPIPTTQKSLLLREESTPYVVEETPVPTPGPKDVLVQIFACALNPVDHAIVDPPYSKILIQEWPHIPGSDGAGVVVALGAEVTNLKEGDKVYVCSSYSATLCCAAQILTCISVDSVFQGSGGGTGATCQQ